MMADTSVSNTSLINSGVHSILHNITKGRLNTNDTSPTDYSSTTTFGSIDFNSGSILNDTYTERTYNDSYFNEMEDFYEDEDYPFETAFGKSFILVCYATITLLGVLFNTLTIIVFTKGKRSSTRDIRILIINLAIVDMVYSITGPIPDALAVINVSFPDSVVLCRMYRFTYLFSTYGSPLANLAIAIERLVIVFSPVRTLRLRNRRRTMLYIISSFWLFDLAVTFEYLFSPKIVKGYDGGFTCRSNTYMGRNHPVIFTWLLLVKFVGPALLIVIIYTIIGVKLTMCQPVGTALMANHIKRQSKARNKIVKMLTIVATVTLIAWAPFNIYDVFSQYDDPLDHVKWGVDYTENILFALQLTNGFTSPIVYFIYDRYFKKDLCELIGCGWYTRRRKPAASVQYTQTTNSTKAVATIYNTATVMQQQLGQEQITVETEIR